MTAAEINAIGTVEPQPMTSEKKTRECPAIFAHR